MPSRRGGLVGDVGRRLLESAATRVGMYAVPADDYDRVQDGRDLADRLQEAEMDARLARRQSSHLGKLVLAGADSNAGTQDLEPDDRIDMAQRARYVAQRDSHVLFATRLRVAFTFGRGIPKPEASDPDVQAIAIDRFWDDENNRRELTTYAAQARKGWALFTQCNIYPVVFDDGLDGMVRLGHLAHDAVIGTVRDREVTGRVLYYKVKQWIPAPYDFNKGAPSRAGKWRLVYYESFEGFAELEAEGRTPPEPAPEERLMPGRVYHVAINRSEEQDFGVPELRANMKWAAAFNDILKGQVEKAKSAQRFLMKVKSTGATTGNALLRAAMNVVNRRSPLANAELPTDDDGTPAGTAPGSDLWENGGLTAEPFALDSGAAAAQQDMQGAVDAYAAGTNYPGYYFHGDPGALAGATAAELPVLKLSDSDQELVEGVVRALIAWQIQRCIDVGLLTKRRPPTDEEITRGVEVGPDGMVERDLTFEVKMPDVLRRNLPEVMQLIADTAATFDPMGTNLAMNRWLFGKVLTQIFDVADPSAIVDDLFPEDEALPADPTGGRGGGPAPPPGSIGADGKRHSSGNPYGAQQSATLVEAALDDLAGRLLRRGAARAREHDEDFARALEEGSR
jgi:hypothetical protein